jgi:hypothetical protein
VLTGAGLPHVYLADAFRYRIEQALAGRPHAGPLPRTAGQFLDGRPDLEPPDGASQGRRFQYPMWLYAVDRMRCASRILEPEERIDPYLTTALDPLAARLIGLFGLLDAPTFTRRVSELWDGVTDLGGRVHILAKALSFLRRGGDAFAADFLARSIPVLEAATRGEPVSGRDIDAALAGGLTLAAHLRRPDLARSLLALVPKLGRRDQTTLSASTLEGAVECTLGFEPPGEVERRLREWEATITPAAAAELSRRPLVLMLPLAAGWFRLGQDTRAYAILDGARTRLAGAGRMSGMEKALLACNYLRALGHAPAAVAWAGIEQYFTEAVGPPDTWTTYVFYSRAHLGQVEAAVLAVAENGSGPDRALWVSGPAG